MRLAIQFVCLAALAAAQPAASFQLDHVVIVTRHGVRSPTWTAERLAEYSSAPWPEWGVQPGYLTPGGFERMKLMGNYYREYLTHEGLLKPGECSGVKLRADSDQRTVETARALAEAILPGCKTPIDAKAEGEDDPLFNALKAGAADRNLGVAAIAGRIGNNPQALAAPLRPAFDTLQSVLLPEKPLLSQPIVLGPSKGDGLADLSGPLATASTMSENLLLEYANGFAGEKLGWGRLDESKLRQVLSLHTTYADLTRRTPYIARARAANLFKYIVESLEHPAEKVLIISGHDTNLSNLSGMLGLSWLIEGYPPDDTPPGGALVFNVWKSAGGESRVTLQYVAQTLEQIHKATPLSLANPPGVAPVFVPGCSHAAEGFPCSLAGLKNPER